MNSVFCSIVLITGVAACVRSQGALTEALDHPDLTWSTGGEETWEGAASDTAISGGALARCGPMAEPPWFFPSEPVSGWIETTVTGPGTFRIFVRSNGDPYLTATLRVDGVEEARWSWEQNFDWERLQNPEWDGQMTEWRALSCPLQPGANKVRLTACLGCDGAGAIQLYGPTIEADFAETLPVLSAAGDALDAPAFTWLTAGVPGFLPVQDVTHDGVDALHSAPQEGASWLQTEVTGPATARWWRKGPASVLIERLGFNNALYDEWTQESAFIPSGRHTIRWEEAIYPPQALWLDEFSTVPASAVSLAEALDAPAQIFTSSFGWQGHTTTAAWDGTDVAWVRVREKPAWLETTLTGPALVEFTSAARGAGTELKVLVDGRPATFNNGTFYSENSARQAFVLEGGTHLIRWEARLNGAGDSEALWMLDALKLTPLSPDSLAGGLDATGLTWTSGGDGTWLAGNWAAAHDGTDVVFSPPITADQTSYLETTVTGPGTLAFWWRAPNDWYFRYRLRIDGHEVHAAGYSFNSPWEQEFLELPAGNHTVRWEVASSGSHTAGFFLLDEVQWTPTAAPPASAALDLTPTLIHSSELPWALDTAVHSDGTDSLRIGPLEVGQTAGLTLWIQGPARVEMKVLTASAYFHVSVDGSVAQSSRAADWSNVVFLIPPGMLPLKFTAGAISEATPLHAAWIDSVTVTPTALPLAEALGTPGRIWRTNPANPWSGIAAGDNFPVRASPGPGGLLSSSWLETTVSGPALLRFTTAGSLQLLMDGVSHVRVNNNSLDTARRAMLVPPGEHIIRWDRSLDSQIIPALSGVTIAPMNGTPSIAFRYGVLEYTVPLPAGYPASSIVLEGGPNLSSLTPMSTIRWSTGQEVIFRLAPAPGEQRIFLRAKYSP